MSNVDSATTSEADVVQRSLDAPLAALAIEVVAVLFVATAVVCLLFWQMVTNVGSTVVGAGGDSLGTVSWLYSLQHEGGYHLFGHTHHTLTGAPFGWDGANGLNIQWLLPYYPAYLLTKAFGPVAAQNLVILSGFVFSGAAMYLLVRYLGCSRFVAAWAGLVYIVFPWHLMRAVHASLVHLELLPLLLMAMTAAARNPTWRRFALVAGVTVACWLTSGYFGAMAVVGAVAFAIGVALSRTGPRARQLLLGAVVGVVTGSFLVAGLSELAGVGRGNVVLHRTAEVLRPWGLHPIELVVPAAGNFIFGHWTKPFFAARQHGSYSVETTNYLGVLTIALAVAWLVLAWRRRSTLGVLARIVTPGLTAVAVIALVLALPSPISVFGHNFPMPSRLVWQIVPPFRVPARWSALAVTAIVPLAALALQAAATRASHVRTRWKHLTLGPVVVTVAIVVSFMELAVNPAASRVSTKDVPGEYAALAQSPNGIVAEYPLVAQIGYLFGQTFHHRPLLDTDAFGTPADDEQHALVNPRTPGAAEQLALLGVTAIVTHPAALRWSPAPYPPNPANWGPGYRLVARAPDGSSVWDVVAHSAPALIAAVSGFSAPLPLKDANPGYALVAPSGVGYFSIRSREAQVVELSFDAKPPRNRTRDLRLADMSNERHFPLRGVTHVSLPVAIPRGFSLVLVKTDPAATSLGDAIVISNIRIRPTSAPPGLNAVLENADPGF